jgi:hypothetical protein
VPVQLLLGCRGLDHRAVGRGVAAGTAGRVRHERVRAIADHVVDPHLRVADRVADGVALDGALVAIDQVAGLFISARRPPAY